MFDTAPKTLDEAVDRILIAVAEAPDGNIIELDENEFVARVHHGLGRNIRNYWGLWQQKNKLYTSLNEAYDLTHADDLSSVILHATWQKHHKQAINVDQVVKKCKDHWANIEAEQ